MYVRLLEMVMSQPKETLKYGGDSMLFYIFVSIYAFTIIANMIFAVFDDEQ